MFLCTDAVLHSFQGVWVCMYTHMHMCFCVQTNLVPHAGICCPSPLEKQGLLPSRLPWYLRWNMLLSMKWFPCKTPGCWGQGVFVGYTESAPESTFCLVVTFNLDLSWNFFSQPKVAEYTPYPCKCDGCGRAQRQQRTPRRQKVAGLLE